MSDTYLIRPRLVSPEFTDGRPMPGEESYWVNLYPSGLLIGIASDRGNGTVVIDRFAWAGIVRAVADMQAEMEEVARQVNTVVSLLPDEEGPE